MLAIFWTAKEYHLPARPRHDEAKKWLNTEFGTPCRPCARCSRRICARGRLRRVGRGAAKHFRYSRREEHPILVGQCAPLRPGTQDPRDSVEHRSRVPPRASPTVGPSSRSQDCLDELPLGIAEQSSSHALLLPAFPRAANSDEVRALFVRPVLVTNALVSGNTEITPELSFTPETIRSESNEGWFTSTLALFSGASGFTPIPPMRCCWRTPAAVQLRHHRPRKFAQRNMQTAMT